MSIESDITTSIRQAVLEGDMGTALEKVAALKTVYPRGVVPVEVRQSLRMKIEFALGCGSEGSENLILRAVLEHAQSSVEPKFHIPVYAHRG